MNQTTWQKIEELFDTALELPSEKRSDFLEHSCIGESEIKNQVKALLAKAEAEDSFLGKPNLSLGMKLIHQEKGTSLLGEQIGRYKIAKLLAEGGMGEVYLAEDLSLNRLIALKLLPDYLIEDDESVNRFQKEALAASAISHPNIAHIYEAGIENNRRFIAMEYVEGTTLRDLLKQKKLDVIMALDIALQIANALFAAHSAGIIHRDIKPENIMLRTDGYVKVLDFGVAKLSDIQTKNHVKISPQMSLINTTPGMVMGTIGYIAPEQLRNKKVDSRADIWSLGVVLYEMLVGRKPFESKTAEEISKAILKKNPPPLSFSTINPKDEILLKNIIAKTLQKETAKRYKSAADLAKDLKELKQHLEFNQQFFPADIPTKKILSEDNETAGQSQNSIFLTKTRQFWNKQSFSRKVLSLTFLIGLLTFSFGVSVQYFSQFWDNKSPNLVVSTIPKIESLAVLPFENETGNTQFDYLSEGLAEDLTRNLGKLNAIRVIAFASTRKMRDVDDLKEIRDRLQTDSIVRGKVEKQNEKLIVSVEFLNADSGAVVWQDSIQAADNNLLKLRDSLAVLLSTNLQGNFGGAKNLVVSESSTQSEAAYRIYLTGRFASDRNNLAGIKRTAENLERAVTLDANFAQAYVALAESYNLIGTWYGEKPQIYLPKAKAAVKKALLLDETSAEAHTILAKMKMDNEHDWAATEREFKRAIELNPNYALAHHWYGEVYLSAMGRFDESIRELETAHTLNPLASTIITGLAWSHLGKKNYQKVIEICDQALQINAVDNTAFAYKSMALTKLERYDEAIETAKKSSVRGETSDLGVIYGLSGRTTEARQALRELRNNPNISPYNLAVIYAAIGEKDRAFELLEKQFKTKSVNLLSIRVDPFLDSLRNDERFKKLEEKLNLPNF